MSNFTEPVSQEEQNDRPQWLLRLYVAGQTPKTKAALSSLKHVCEKYLKGQYKIEIVDLLIHPELAKADQIVALPSLVRQLPPPVKKIIGDLASEERLLIGLNLQRRIFNAPDPSDLVPI